MARGYFGRMVFGGGVAALRPSRPVSNLWKSARMEGPETPAAEALAAENTAEAPVRKVRRVMPEAEPQRVPATSTVAVKRAARSVGTEESPARVTQSARVSAPRQEVSRMKPRRTQASAPEIASAPMVAEAPKQEQPAVIVRESRRADGRDPLIPAAEFRPNLEPTRVRQHVVPVRGEAAEATSAVVSTVKSDVTAAASKREAAEMNPLQIDEPVRHRERTLREEQEESRGPSSTKNSVQIGKIEVQVVSPPAPVRYVAAPAAPKGRLARGYTLWPAWQ